MQGYQTPRGGSKRRWSQVAPVLVVVLVAIAALVIVRPHLFGSHASGGQPPAGGGYSGYPVAGGTTSPPAVSSSSPTPVVTSSSPVAAKPLYCDGTKPIVVLDPGHSGGGASGGDFSSTAEVDGPAVAGYNSVDIDGSGVESIDNGGAPNELVTMWHVALAMRTLLDAHGYDALITKPSEFANVGLLTRAQFANEHHAAIAVSLHFTGDIPFGVPNDHFGVTPQVVGEYRTNESNGDTYRFPASLASVAALSQKYAADIAAARTAAGDPVKVSPLDESFPRSRGLPAYGNISIVQLFSKVPWVYNEEGSVGFKFNAYTDGIANGIMTAVPVSVCAG